MAAITISRELGSRGGRIARDLAAALGWEYADKSTINRVIRQYGLIRLDALYDTPPRLRELFSHDSQLTIEMMNETIAAIAARGNVVILGRGGFVVLAQMADVLNVRLVAPEATRIARVAKRDGIRSEDAAPKVAADDRLRKRFVHRYYGADWDDPAGYDLVIDSGQADVAQTTAQIGDAFRALPAPAADARLSARLEINPVLARTVAEVMDSHPA